MEDKRCRPEYKVAVYYLDERLLNLAWESFLLPGAPLVGKVWMWIWTYTRNRSRLDNKIISCCLTWVPQQVFVGNNDCHTFVVTMTSLCHLVSIALDDRLPGSGYHLAQTIFRGNTRPWPNANQILRLAEIRFLPDLCGLTNTRFHFPILLQKARDERPIAYPVVTTVTKILRGSNEL